MKTTFTSLAFVFVSSSLVAAPKAVAAELASLNRTAVVATLEAQHGGAQVDGVQNVALLADGRVQVVGGRGGFKQIQLTPAASRRLLEKAQVLADAQITATSPRMVCKMMSVAELNNLQVSSYDEATSSFTSQVRTVLTGDTCDLTYKAKPTEAYAHQMAVELRAQLQVLGFNTEFKVLPTH